MSVRFECKITADSRDALSDTLSYLSEVARNGNKYSGDSDTEDAEYKWFIEDQEDTEEEKVEEEPKVNPCPLCGGPAEFVKDGGSWVIRCMKCHCQSGRFSQKDDYMVEKWNTSYTDLHRGLALKPCPVCNGPAVIWHNEGKIYAGCDEEECYFQTPGMATEIEAAELWNNSAKKE